MQATDQLCAFNEAIASQIGAPGASLHIRHIAGLKQRDQFPVFPDAGFASRLQAMTPACFVASVRAVSGSVIDYTDSPRAAFLIKFLGSLTRRYSAQ